MVAEGEAIRVDKPDPRLPETRPGNGALPAPPKTREDYYRTERQGEKVYASHANSNQTISVEEWKLLPSATGDKTTGDDSSTPISPANPATKSSSPFAKGPLSEREAKELWEPLVTALPDVGHYLDQGLWLYNPAEDGRDIWGEMSRPEAEMLAEALLSWGRRHTVVAVGIRETVYLKKYAAIAAFVIPRGKKTYTLIRTAPRRPRRRMTLFRQEATP